MNDEAAPVECSVSTALTANGWLAGLSVIELTELLDECEYR